MPPTTPKRAYHHGDLRQSLMDAACRHMREEGVEQLSLRGLAREVGVSQTAPYRHFESKNALFAAIATWGFELMAEHLRQARDQHAEDVEEAFVEIGVAYVEWALQNPEKYQLFFDSSLVDFSEYIELQIAGTQAFEVLLGLVRRGQEEGVFADHMSAEALAGATWSSVHGMTSLLQKNTPMDKFTGREEQSVPTALGALATNRREIMKLFVNTIRKY